MIPFPLYRTPSFLGVSGSPAAHLTQQGDVRERTYTYGHACELPSLRNAKEAKQRTLLPSGYAWARRSVRRRSNLGSSVLWRRGYATMRCTRACVRARYGGMGSTAAHMHGMHRTSSIRLHAAS